MEKTATISLLVPLDHVNKSVYADLMNSADKIKVGSGLKLRRSNVKTQRILVNYAYLIYEELKLKKKREVNYDQVRAFAKNEDFRDILKSLLNKYVSSPEFNFWLQDDIDVLTMGMTASTNRANKNIFH